MKPIKYNGLNKFKKGQFIKNKDPYEGEGEYLIVGIDYSLSGELYGYLCRAMKGKHVSEHDFNNYMIIHKTEENAYKVVG